MTAAMCHCDVMVDGNEAWGGFDEPWQRLLARVDAEATAWAAALSNPKTDFGGYLAVLWEQLSGAFVPPPLGLEEARRWDRYRQEALVRDVEDGLWGLS